MDLLRPEAALKCFDEGLQVDPKELQLLNAKGAALILIQQSYLYKVQIDLMMLLNIIIRPQLSILILQKALIIKVMLYEKYYSLIFIYSLNRFEEAIRCYDQAISLDPTFAKSYNNKGLALNAMIKRT